MKKIHLLFIFMVSAKIMLGQNPTTIFAQHQDSIPVENIYMQFDKQAYVSGEAIWFKAYLFIPGASNNISTNFYTELLNEKGVILQSKKFPVVAGKGITGQFDIPSNATQGIYIVRAWTNYTAFFDQSYIFNKAIPVFNPSNATEKNSNEPGYVFE